MKPKNTICLWFDKDAHEAARFYAATFPDSKVTAVHKAPGDYPSGKEGDVLTQGQTILELENEKAVAPIPSPAAGKVGSIRVKPGDKLSVGRCKPAVTPKWTGWWKARC